MRSEKKVVRTTLYISDVMPEVSTESAELAEVLAWADATPTAWKIVTSSRSAPFGKRSSTYMGWAQGSDSPSAVLERLATFRRELELPNDDFFGWKARFTLDHFGDKGFQGGLFQQFDGAYDRGCSYLDYTPETLEEVIDRFLAWCDAGFKFSTASVKIDKRIVRTLAKEPSRV